MRWQPFSLTEAESWAKAVAVGGSKEGLRVWSLGLASKGLGLRVS
jgi:hypothetical protein